MADDDFATDPTLRAELDAELENLSVGAQVPTWNPERDDPKPTGTSLIGHQQHRESKERRATFIDAIQQGGRPIDIVEEMGVSIHTYYDWRRRHPKFAAAVDAAKILAHDNERGWDGSIASFIAHFFGFKLTWFQLHFIRELERTPPGNILMVLWPPEFGKTTTFENYASTLLATKPEHRFLVASESRGIAQKILGRVMDRMAPDGPFPEYVARFGPFVPEPGRSRGRTMWSDVRFSTQRKRGDDERDYSMLAVGGGSKNIVSTRTNHAHVDDLQSTSTLTQSDKLETWFRQDLLSRPGETGITSICGTRVGDDDFYERLLNDESLDAGIMKVIRYPAIITDHLTGEQSSLDPERWSLDQLERQRKKVGSEAWDRNYMQNPGLSSKGRGTFSKDIIEPCLDPQLSLRHRPDMHAIIYLGLDPAIDSKNCVIAVEATPNQRLIVRAIREDLNLKNNTQIINAVGDVCEQMGANGASVTDVVVEAMSFQKGLIYDERLMEIRNQYGFQVRDHLTGWNKYDADIGVPSMVESFIKREITLPWADDDYTRFEVGELVRQLYAWKPGVRGNRLRQDRVMALWFTWIIWRERWKKAREHTAQGDNAWQRKGLPYTPTSSGLLLPTRRTA